MVGLNHQIKPTIMVLFMGTLKWRHDMVNVSIGTITGVGLLAG